MICLQMHGFMIDLELVTVEVDGLDCGVCDLDVVRVGAVVEPGVDLNPERVLVAPIRLMIVSNESSGLPRQLS